MGMNELLVGYARVSTEQQDLTAQRNGLHALGVGDDRNLRRPWPKPAQTETDPGFGWLSQRAEPVTPWS